MDRIGVFPCAFFRNNSDSLLVFLPSSSVDKPYPYYPRISIKDKISNFDFLYIADPFQDDLDYSDSGGSWFIDKNGVSVLPDLASLIDDFRIHNNYRRIIFYGSSMGGYASIILAAIIDGANCIAECPQIYLYKHPDSSYVLNKFCAHLHRSIYDIENFLPLNSNSSFKIICSVYDHHVSDHVIPFVNWLSANELNKSRFEISLFCDDSYSRGHVALNIKDCIKVLSDPLFFNAES
jgi:hypothetical protein